MKAMIFFLSIVLCALTLRGQTYDQIHNGIDSIQAVETICRHNFIDKMDAADTTFLIDNFNLYKSFTISLNEYIAAANSFNYESDKQKADLNSQITLVNSMHSDYAAAIQYALKQYLKRFWMQKIKDFSIEITKLVLKKYLIF